MFRSGEILVYERDVWSHYDATTGYVFRTPGDPSVRVWDLPDDGDLESWRDLFEKL